MIYQLENEQLRVQVKSTGAELTSIYDKQAKRELLWQGDAAFWGRQAPVLFPIVGRLKNNQYQYQQQNYNLSGHGFARDQQFTCIYQGDQELVFELHDTVETKQVYPFAFVLRIHYVLQENKLQVQYKVYNPSVDQTLYFSIGGHPGFNVPIDEQGDFQNVHLSIEEQKVRERYFVDGVLIQEEVREEEWETRPLQRQYFTQDAMIFATPEKTAVSLILPKCQLTVTSDCPYFGIWSPTTKAPFVCIEPWWGMADSVNSEGDFCQKRGLQSVPARTSWLGQYTIAYQRN